MSIFQKLKRKNNPFRVVIEGSEDGLSKLVDSALSGQKATITLADAKMPEPVERIEVYLHTGVQNYSGTVGYKWDVKLVPCVGQHLRISPKHFPGFDVNRYKSRSGCDSYFLHSPHIAHNPIQVQKNWPGNENGVNISYFSVTGNSRRLIQTVVWEEIQDFAHALEDTINSVYRSARKPVPENPLVLQQLYRT